MEGKEAVWFGREEHAVIRCVELVLEEVGATWVIVRSAMAAALPPIQRSVRERKGVRVHHGRLGYK